MSWSLELPVQLHQDPKMAPTRPGNALYVSNLPYGVPSSMLRDMLAAEGIDVVRSPTCQALLGQAKVWATLHAQYPHQHCCSSTSAST